jgi:hypothetical protein
MRSAGLGTFKFRSWSIDPYSRAEVRYAEDRLFLLTLWPTHEQELLSDGFSNRGWVALFGVGCSTLLILFRVPYFIESR